MKRPEFHTVFSFHVLLIVTERKNKYKEEWCNHYFSSSSKVFTVDSSFSSVLWNLLEVKLVWSSSEVPSRLEGCCFPETADKTDQVQGDLIWNSKKDHRAVGFPSVVLTYAPLHRK